MTQTEALRMALEALGLTADKFQKQREAITAVIKALAQPEQEPVAIKHMAEWVEYLKRQSDHGQHLRIPSGMSAGTCWDLARELEQFINTTPPQRKPLSNQKIIEMYNEPRSDAEMIEFARAIEAAHGIKE